MITNKKSIIWLTVLFLLVTAGCSKQQATRPPQAVAVKAMQVIQQDTPVTYEYVGEIVAKDEVPIKAQISGNISRKLVKGGDIIQAGQPLFEIDQRKYAAVVADAEAQVAQAQASLSNVRRDVRRYQSLADQGAIAVQTLDTTSSQAEQYQAQVNAYQAKLDQARKDLDDTQVVSPVDGRIGVGELSAGAYVTAGSTVLATVSTVDPVQVSFSMSENEYLKFAKIGSSPDAWGQNLKLILSDGSEYPVAGHLDQIDRGLANQTGTLAMKASFGNPQQLLVPGMFAKIVATGETRQGALLIPQRAVQEMLGKTFVTIVGPNSEAVTRQVKLGPKIGNLQIIEDGLALQDVVVVEGFAKAQPGTPLNVTMIGLNDLAIPGVQ
ncbi:efflux RND transporter periplasmic adaptor subunit [Sporomusa acidovorans]|uniref:Efflux pump periplasmic linker BepF n=1 Tax=Sporomusa acidovorans (strain ATCC 49682 / DSM 3132 / Mol) TaxID=1123286 RepID=A0ABZ3J0S1_SPOA4|nr:efflux RND transporter periplasmic adaptor subunit [Sporomusa acidovorans]OZC22836.1 efflux pump periplasmic linker BepF [Sporomusa acidovorans DSM 3132]SDE52459.1 membrane fusion protein, multidrug efflux system [Sporomusa acidovorans]